MTKTKHHDRKAAPPGEAVRAADVDESSSNARADAPTPTTRIHAAPDLRALTPDEALARAMEFATLAAVYLPARAVRKNPKNPRIHGDEVVNLARSIVRTAWGAPILVQASAMKIIGGHGRIESAHLILDGIEVDGVLRGGPQHIFRRYAPPGCIPVCVIDVDDATADAMTLADNAKRLQGRDDPSALVAMATASFERNAPTMLDLGLGADDLDALIRQAGDAVLKSAPTGDGESPAFKGDPNGTEYDESVEQDVDAVDCPHCGKRVPLPRP